MFTFNLTEIFMKEPNSALYSVHEKIRFSLPYTYTSMHF